MDTTQYLIKPLIDIITIVGFVAIVAAAVWFFTEKTQIGARVKAATPWMGWSRETLIPNRNRTHYRPSNRWH